MSSETPGTTETTIDDFNILDEDLISRPIEGPVPLVELSTSAHRKFIEIAEPDWVLVKMNNISGYVEPDSDDQEAQEKKEACDTEKEFREWLEQTGRITTASDITPSSVNVATTSTVHDSVLKNFSQKKEINRINRFNPDAHIGADVPAYSQWDRQTRGKGIRTLALGAGIVNNETRDSIDIIPVLRGDDLNERKEIYTVLDTFDHSQAALYVTEYFTSDAGGGITDIKERLERIQKDRQYSNIASAGELSLILIGLLSPSLEKMPDLVDAAAGLNGWRKRLGVSTSDEFVPEDTARQWEELSNLYSDCLNSI
jgi:hypothetical protein